MAKQRTTIEKVLASKIGVSLISSRDLHPTGASGRLDGLSSVWSLPSIQLTNPRAWAHDELVSEYVAASLEAENVQLRNRVVELALEIQDLQSRVRPEEATGWTELAKR